MAILREIAKVYLEIIRGTPMLVQILIVYFGIPQDIRTMLPSFVKQFIISIKDTSLMSMVGLESTNTFDVKSKCQ